MGRYRVEIDELDGAQAATGRSLTGDDVEVDTEIQGAGARVRSTSFRVDGVSGNMSLDAVKIQRRFVKVKLIKPDGATMESVGHIHRAAGGLVTIHGDPARFSDESS